MRSITPPEPCEVCGEPGYYTTALCYKHYTRKKRHGSPHILKKEKVNDLTQERILSKIIVDDNGCWIWQDALNNKGYGSLAIAGRRMYAHRASYKAYFGEFDYSLFVCHRCDVTNCVNPKHLFLGTQKDNMQDMASKNRGWYQRAKTPL